MHSFYSHLLFTPSIRGRYKLTVDARLKDARAGPAQRAAFGKQLRDTTDKVNRRPSTV